MATRQGGDPSAVNQGEAEQAKASQPRGKGDVQPGGQGRVKDPSTDRRLKQNRDKSS